MLLMRERLLSWCYKLGINGDMKAARLFLETSVSKSAGTSIQTQQNNYIQINQFKLSQETIQQLQPEQLKQIENVLQQIVTTNK